MGLRVLGITPHSNFGSLSGWTFIGRRLRKITGQLKILTVPEFFEKRYNDTSHLLRYVVAGIIVVFMTFYVQGQNVATGKIYRTLVGWDYAVAILAAGITVLIYIILGGYLAVAWTDVIQGIMMIGGWDGLIIGLEKVKVPTTVWEPTGAWLLWFIGMTIGTGMFGYSGQPQLHARYMAVRDTRTLARAVLIGTIVQVVFLFGYGLGVAGIRVVYLDKAMLPGNDPELSLIWFFIDKFHPVLGALFVAAALAAIMSTADSLILSAASSCVEDVYRIRRPDAAQSKLLLVSRIFTIIIVAFATLFALYPAVIGPVVAWLVWWDWSMLTAIAAPLMLSLYWKRTTKWGVLFGLLVGAAASFIWGPFVLKLHDVAHTSFITFIAGFITAVIVSLATKKPSEEVQSIVDIGSGKIPATIKAAYVKGEAEHLNLTLSPEAASSLMAPVAM